MKENKNISNLLIGSNIINMVCKDIAVSKTYIEVTELLIEELSELLQAVIKLQRWENGEIALRYDFNEIYNAVELGKKSSKPFAIVAHTIKGKGVSFMENQAGWHGKAPNDEQLAQALAELGE